MLVLFGVVAGAQADVYWTNQQTGTIGRANQDGTSSNQSLITGASAPGGIRDRRRVGLLGQREHQLDRPRRTSTGPAPIRASSPAQRSAFGVAVDGQHVYWANSTLDRSGAPTSTAPASIDASSPAPRTRARRRRRSAYLLDQRQRRHDRSRQPRRHGPAQNFITGANGPLGLRSMANTSTGAPSTPRSDGRTSMAPARTSSTSTPRGPPRDGGRRPGHLLG